MLSLRSPLLFLAFLLMTTLFAQNADVRGTVSDTSFHLALSGSQLTLSKNGSEIKTIYSNEQGEFIFQDLPAGNYELSCYFVGYPKYTTSFTLRSDQTKFIEIIMDFSNTTDMIDVFHTDLDIDGGIDEPKDGDEGVKSPYGGIGFIGTDVSLTRRGDGGFAFSDGRPEQTKVFQNGVAQIGGVDRFSLNVSQVRAVSKGAPARYGDFTGGVIESTPMVYHDTIRRFTAQLTSNQFISPFGHNDIETFMYMPLLVKDKRVIFGLNHALFVSYHQDNYPSLVQSYAVDPYFLDSIIQQPLSNTIDGTSLPTYYFVDPDNINALKRHNNADAFNFSNQFNLYYTPVNGLVIGIQPNYSYNRSRSYVYSNSLFNAEHNPLITSHTAKLNVNVKHKIRSLYDSQGNLQFDSSKRIGNLSYTLIADYQRFNSKTQDPVYRDQIFEYGHVGQFTTQTLPAYTYREDERTVTDQNGQQILVNGYHEFLGYQNIGLSYTPGSNPYSAMFNNFLFDENDISSLNELQQLQGLLNGQYAPNVYGMWQAPGTVISRYGKSDYQKGSVSAIVEWSYHPAGKLANRHDMEFGLLLEQSKRSYYSLNASGLWNIMPLLLNQQYTRLDVNNPILTYDASGVFTDTLNYNYVIDLSKQKSFDQNLRNVVGLDNGTRIANAHFIDVQSIDPSALSLEMFSADELWNSGNPYVSYSGYDHTGKMLKVQGSQLDFLDKKLRTVPAFSPIYTAMWLQDKFVINDLNIRAGFRFERYDANTVVLKDKYCLYPTHTLAEVKSMPQFNENIPSSLDNDAVVYVDNMDNPTQIVGYRVGDQWYDETGEEVSSAETIRTSTDKGVIQPFLVDPQDQSLKASSFKDYDPEWMLLPRLSISFPINTSATFFVYYDRFAQRPNYGQSFSPMNTYAFIEQNTNAILANPSLKASRRTDYQIGFKQALSRETILSLSAGYAEIQDDINLVSVDQAYPISYLTYENIDFATVKSFRAGISTKKDKLSFRMNYMLQFADGTGSNVNSALALVQSNQPNLRSLYPLSYDVRHKLNSSVNIDLFELGGVLNHPMFKNSSLNIYYNTQSGSPYTAYLNAIPEAQTLGVPSRSQIKGNPYGSRLPWTKNLDVSYIKGINYRGGIYEIQVNALNILNLENIVGVYSYSGLPNDDGFLSSQIGQQTTENQVDPSVFQYLYNLKQQNPSHYGGPRRISLTVRAYL